MPKIEDYFKISVSHSGFMADENTLIYISDESGINQIYKKLLSTGQVVQLTFLKDRVWQISPEMAGRTAFFSSDVGGNEQVQIFSIDIDSGENHNLTNNPAARFAFGGVLPGNEYIVASSNARNPANYDLVKINIANGKTEILLENQDNYNIPAALSPDGRYLLYNKMNGISENYLWMLDFESCLTHRIHPEGSFAQYKNPCWTPDSKGFFLITDWDDDFCYVAHYDLDTHTLSRFYEPDWDASGLALSDDGRYLAVNVNEDGYFCLKVFDLHLGGEVNTPKPPQGVIPSFYGFNFSGPGHRLIFPLMSVRRPGNVWMLDIDNDALCCLTPTLWAGLSPDMLIEPELHRFSSFDGLSVPYWLYRKPGTEAGAPVVFDIHGGPEGQEWPTYEPLLAYLINEGFTIVAPNVRGSTGYGKRYHHLDDKEKRLDSIADVAALAEHLVKTGIAQPGKMGIMGASYGGFMTLSGITEYPKLFSAAVDTVGMSNLETFLENTAEYRRAHRESEYGNLANDREILRRVSPIHKADRIITPLMVVHGANDPRVPLSEAEQIVGSLKSRGIAVKFLCYPDEGHGLAKLENRLDCYPQVAAFLKEHLMS
jgi:dipeptidyl aminopeptidase/acylaminoacyl peptidase